MLRGDLLIFFVDRYLSVILSNNSCVVIIVSQVSTRLITFGLNLATARLLTVDTYGVMRTVSIGLATIFAPSFWD
jgi:hypothetical protein